MLNLISKELMILLKIYLNQEELNLEIKLQNFKKIKLKIEKLLMKLISLENNKLKHLMLILKNTMVLLKLLMKLLDFLLHLLTPP